MPTEQIGVSDLNLLFSAFCLCVSSRTFQRSCQCPSLSLRSTHRLKSSFTPASSSQSHYTAGRSDRTVPVCPVGRDSVTNLYEADPLLATSNLSSLFCFCVVRLDILEILDFVKHKVCLFIQFNRDWRYAAKINQPAADKNTQQLSAKPHQETSHRSDWGRNNTNVTIRAHPWCRPKVYLSNCC